MNEVEISALLARKEYLMLNLQHQVQNRNWEGVQNDAIEIRIINAKLIVYGLLQQIAEQEREKE